MKTAEEQRIEENFVFSLSVEQRKLYQMIKRANQLDAMKEGARRAAEELRPWVMNGPHQRILTTAEQWTEKDL